jgi:hypothetical protein
VAVGDQIGWPELLRLHLARLRRMVALRLDPRPHSRIDPSDVLQAAYTHASRGLLAYLQNPEVLLFVWPLRLAGHRPGRVHRERLGANVRNRTHAVPGGMDGVVRAWRLPK